MNLALFDGMDSTAWNGAVKRTNLALFDGVDSTAWNGGVPEANLALFDGMDSTAWNGAAPALRLALFDGVERTASGGERLPMNRWDRCRRNEPLTPMTHSAGTHLLQTEGIRKPGKQKRPQARALGNDYGFAGTA